MSGIPTSDRTPKRRGRRASEFSWALVCALAFLGIFSAAAQAGDLKVPTFDAPGLNSVGAPSNRAGERPYELLSNFEVNRLLTPESTFGGSPPAGPAENIKNLDFDLPPGFVGSAASFPHCTQEDFNKQACPTASQIGIVRIGLSAGQGSYSGIFNMAPPPGMPAQFAFQVILANVHVDFHVRTGSDYGVTATLRGLNEGLGLLTSDVTIWGVPGDPRHDALRFTGNGTPDPGPYPEPPPYRPFLSNPTSCGRPLITTMEAVTWQLQNEITSAPPFEAPAMTGCDEVDFQPTIDAKPTTHLADSPSGLDFHLHIPQSQDAEGDAVAQVRESTVALPPSLTVNPSSANGLGACSLQQIGYLGSGSERQLLRYDLPPAGFSGSFTVSFRNQSTAPIPATANRATVMQAIESLPGLAGNVSLRGAPGGWIVTFVGNLAGAEVPQLSGAVTDNSSQTLTVTGEGGGFYLQYGGVDGGSTFEASFEAGATSLIRILSHSRVPKVGDPIKGPGIAPGTTITEVVNFFGNFLISVSTPTTEAQAAADLISELPFDASAEEIGQALQSIPALGHENLFPGNVFVSAIGTSGITRTFQLIFAEELNGTEPLIAQTNSLIGAGAGIVLNPQSPPPPHALHVSTLTGDVVPGTPQFTPDPAECPDASKIGTVEISSPAVIDHPLKGSVYLATPHENPFNSLLAIYIAVDDPQSGVVLKLPGLIEADPQTGQLTATVSEAPQLPFEDLNLEFFKGAGAPLKTGIACGTSEVETDMVPWTAPEGATMHPGDSFSIDHGAGGASCAKDETAAPNTPRFEAGTLVPKAGAYSPFTLKLARQDGTQQITGIDTTLPKGLLARLAGTPYCSDQLLAVMAARSGKQEQADPSCPAASQVGTVTIGAGAGPTPFYASGKAYLAGPYKGAALSLAVVTPAVAGPFDLGTVVIRNALFVDPTTAQVHAVSDPFPHILQGIPLDIRSISLTLDRPNFTLNPTNCSPFAITGAIAALTGQSSPLNQHFQVGDCAKLGFKPKLTLALKGQTKRSGNPAVSAVVDYPKGGAYANIAATTVILPRSEFIDQSHVGNPCTRVQFAENACPAKSILGTAVAYTPLLEKPLEGPIYFRSNGGERQLPDLVADLNGQLHVVLVGFIDSVHKKGSETSRVRTRFASVPDAPISSFELHLYGGKRGLLENSKNLCKGVGPATVQMTGQNGKTNDFETAIKSSCGKKKGKTKHDGKKKAKADHGGRK